MLVQQYKTQAQLIFGLFIPEQEFNFVTVYFLEFELSGLDYSKVPEFFSLPDQPFRMKVPYW